MIQFIGPEHDLGGGFKVRRLLPHLQKRMVGPYAFLDHMGPFTAAAGQNTDVRPHPHIGLSTLTYLYEGQIHHRDSLGSSQIIVPGEVNWMTAGKGISHSERTPEARRNSARLLHGLQFWVALPDGAEDVDPSFKHYSSQDIPIIEDDEKKIKLVCGEAFGEMSPVQVTSPMVFADIVAKRNHSFHMSSSLFEFAFYMIDGQAEVAGSQVGPTSMIVFDRGATVEFNVREGSKFIFIGGEPVGERHVWWNLVSSSREKIEDAKRRWKEGTFPMVPGEYEFIPSPER